MSLSKIGASFYVLWGLLHTAAALDQFRVGSTLEPGLVQGKINQGAWDLLLISIVAILIAVRWTWRNGRLGYWINLAMVSAADIGFIIFVFIPGHVAFFPGILGPVFWICAALFSTAAYRREAHHS